jgi:hypothetical protein
MLTVFDLLQHRQEFETFEDEVPVVLDLLHIVGSPQRMVLFVVPGKLGAHDQSPVVQAGRDHAGVEPVSGYLVSDPRRPYRQMRCRAFGSRYSARLSPVRYRSGNRGCGWSQTVERFRRDSPGIEHFVADVVVLAVAALLARDL